MADRSHRSTTTHGRIAAVVLAMSLPSGPLVAQESNGDRGFWVGMGIGVGLEAAIRGTADDVSSSYGSYFRLGVAHSDRLRLGVELSGYSTTRDLNSGRGLVGVVALLTPTATSPVILKGAAGLAGSFMDRRTVEGQIVDRYVSRGIGITVGIGYLRRAGRGFKVTPSVDLTVQNTDIGPSAASWSSIVALTIGIGFY